LVIPKGFVMLLEFILKKESHALYQNLCSSRDVVCRPRIFHVRG